MLPPPTKPQLFNNKFIKSGTGGDDYAQQASPFPPKDRNHKQVSINDGAGQYALSNVSTQETPKVLFTINHVDKRLKGFVDFDLQLPRPDIKSINAHDQRFEPYNMFPTHYSNTHVPRMIDFNHFQARDSKVYHANMSEPCFDSEKHLNLIKPKPKGILQFSKVQSKKQLPTT